MKNLIVFDLDKTLVKGNLHELIVNYWVEESKLRKYFFIIFIYFIRLLCHPWLRRKFEYFPLYFIRQNDIKKYTLQILNDENQINKYLLNRINRYKSNFFEVLLITAAPLNVAYQISILIDIPVYASKTFIGVIYDDLLAKKNRVYIKLMAEGYIIRSIYSDSKLDFNSGSKNFLVSDKYKVTLSV
jgi:phosphoserine phosphatase